MWLKTVIKAVFLFLLYIHAAYANGNITNNYDDLLKYYPLEEGHILNYVFGDKGDSANEFNKITKCVKNEYGSIGCNQETVLMDKIKSTCLLEIRGNTLFITGGSNPLTGDDLTMFDKPTIILKSPLVKNATWSYSYDDTKRTVKVIGILKKYTVIAGEFSEVLKIEDKLYKIDKTTKKYPKKATVVSYDYYAPNVGLIRQEMVINKKIQRGRELIEFKSNSTLANSDNNNWYVFRIIYDDNGPPFAGRECSKSEYSPGGWMRQLDSFGTQYVAKERLAKNKKPIVVDVIFRDSYAGYDGGRTFVNRYVKGLDLCNEVFENYRSGKDKEQEYEHFK